MSSIGRAPSTLSSYRVQFWVDGRRISRNFPTYEAAEAFTLTLDEPLRKRGAKTVGVPARLERHTKRASSGCLLWTGYLDNAGYGQMVVGGSMKLAHRVSYELHVGAIPDGLVIDHLCRVRHCIEPTHLEPVTSRENVLRSPIAPAAINAAKTHCPKGHEYSAENTYSYGSQGGRQCRACARDRYARKAVSP